MAESTIGLMFEIGADPSKAITGTETFRDQASKALRELEGNILEAVRKWTGLSKEFVIGGGIAAGAVAGVSLALYKVASQAAETGTKVFEASEKTGMAAQNLSGLMAVSKLTGENFDSLTMALGRAGRALEVGINNPAGETGKILAGVMGGAQQLTELGLRPMDDRIQTVLQRIFALNDVGERNLALQALLGRGWMTNVSTLQFLAEQGFGPAIEMAKKLGILFDEVGAKKAREFTTEVNLLQAQLGSLARTIGVDLLPPMAKLIATSNILIETWKRADAWTIAKGQVQELGFTIATLYEEIVGMYVPGMREHAIASEVWIENMRRGTDWGRTFNQVAAEQHKTIAALLAGHKGLAGLFDEEGAAAGRATNRLREMVAEEQQALIVLREEPSERRGIVEAYNRQVRAADEALASAKKEAVGHKAALKEIEAAQRQHSELLILIAEERDFKLSELRRKQHEEALAAVKTPDMGQDQKLADTRERLWLEMTRAARQQQNIQINDLLKFEERTRKIVFDRVQRESRLKQQELAALRRHEYQKLNLIRQEIAALQEGQTQRAALIAAEIQGLDIVRGKYQEQAETLISLAGVAEAVAQAIGKSSATAAAFQITSIVLVAMAKIPEMMGKGFEALAEQRYWAAANYFASAAQFGIAAGSQISSVISGIGGDKSSAEPASAGEGASAAPPAGPPAMAPGTQQPPRSTVMYAQRGAIVPWDETLAVLHRNEMVLPERISQMLQNIAMPQYALPPVVMQLAASTSGGLSKSQVQAFIPSSRDAGEGAAADSPEGRLSRLAPMAPARLPGGRVTVIAMGETQTVQWLAKKLNEGVDNKSIRLVSSHTKRPAPAVRSG